MRIILYTGKGGVGKTSVAAASALLAAEMGYSTVIMSSDPAHSLADCLDVRLGHELTPVAPNLWGQEIDVLQEMKAHWNTVQEWLVAILHWQGMDEVVADEVAVLPGMEELASLLHIVQIRDQGQHDLLIVDCAPTAETLRLLSFPDMVRWYMHRLFPLQRRVATAVGPLARGVLGLPVPGGKVFDSVQDLFQQIEQMRSLLLDGAISSVRLVVNPEKMVIKEAQRTFTYLNLYGYHTDIIVCNRMLPDSVEDSFFDGWKESQARHMGLIHEYFDPIPTLKVPLLSKEPVGQDILREMGKTMFGAQDPARLFFTGHAQEVVTEDGRHVLKVKLPFVSQEEVSVLHGRDEIIIQVGHYRRSIFLPRLLAGQEVEEATMDGPTLTIRFKKNSRDQTSL